MPNDLKAPFPYFGGKSSVADVVWAGLGDVKHYIEPFFGSGAVLLARPDYEPARHVETVCDKDGFVANVWRALQADPDAVAKVCDWPVNHADLNARRKRLIAEEGGLIERLGADDEFYNAKLAGYWIWAASCWIGSGLMRPRAMPHVSKAGIGVHALGKIPHVSSAGGGVHKLSLGQMPHVADAGRSAVSALAEVATADVRAPYRPSLYAWFRQLSERLRNVRVVCGDWTRVCGGNWQDGMGVAGIYFDPPYAHDVGRHNDLYHHESADASAAVEEWALARGDRETYRIAISGYDGEHEGLEGHGWTRRDWTACGGYSNRGDNDNRKREAIWFSPHCVDVQATLWARENKGRGKK